MKIKNKERINELVTRFYENRSGYAFNREAFEQSANVNREHVATTYGEIKYLGGVEQIVDNLRLDEDDVFVDLGSGTGRVVVEMFLSTPIKKSIGYELVKERFDHAMEVRGELLNNPLYTINKSSRRKIEFYNQNIVDADLSKATVVYMASTCFSADLLGIILQKLANARKLKAIFALTTMPASANFILKKSFTVATTWNSTTTCYMYVPGSAAKREKKAKNAKSKKNRTVGGGANDKKKKARENNGDVGSV